MGGKMQQWGNSGRSWIRRMKVFRRNESSVHALNLSNMHRYTNGLLADMHSMSGAAQGNGRHPTHLEQRSSLSKDYSLLWVILFFHCRNSAIFSGACIMTRSIKWSTRQTAWGRHSNARQSSPFLPRNHSRYILSELLHFLATSDTRNVRRHILH